MMKLERVSFGHGFHCQLNFLPQDLNLFHTNRLFYKATYNKVKMVHCIYNFQSNIVLLSQNYIDFVLTYNANLDEMLHNVTFPLGLHSLPKYPFRGFGSGVYNGLA